MLKIEKYTQSTATNRSRKKFEKRFENIVVKRLNEKSEDDICAKYTSSGMS
jgi:hypothetical protein